MPKHPEDPTTTASEQGASATDATEGVLDALFSRIRTRLVDALQPHLEDPCSSSFSLISVLSLAAFMARSAAISHAHAVVLFHTLWQSYSKTDAGKTDDEKKDKAEETPHG